jgi:hypothetical protein
MDGHSVYQHFFIDDCRCASIHGHSGKYRIDRPKRMKGGPSPRLRALASHDSLTLRTLAASSGVKVSAEGGLSKEATLGVGSFRRWNRTFEPPTHETRAGGGHHLGPLHMPRNGSQALGNSLRKSGRYLILIVLFIL